MKHKTHVACVSETKMRSEIKLSHDQFTVHRFDHQGDAVAKGGVTIMTHLALFAKVIPLLNLETIEAMDLFRPISITMLT